MVSCKARFGKGNPVRVRRIPGIIYQGALGTVKSKRWGGQRWIYLVRLEDGGKIEYLETELRPEGEPV